MRTSSSFVETKRCVPRRTSGKARLFLDQAAAFVWISIVTAADFFVSSTPCPLRRRDSHSSGGDRYLFRGARFGQARPRRSGKYGWLHFLAESAGASFSRPPSPRRHADRIGGRDIIALGLGTRIAAFFCLSTMLVAALLGHKGGGYLITNNPPGNEYALNLAALMIVIILLGPGPYSLDFLIFSAR